MTAHNPDTREKLLELAERCEAATGPDAKLDEAIEKALPCSRRFAEDNPHAPPTQWNERGAAFHGARIGDCDNFDEYVSPHYTASLDAAMTLVPEGWETSIYIGGENANVQMETPAMRDEWFDEGGGPIDGTAPTPALALCAAALRAREEDRG
jgi:hypothetical protein